MKFLISTILVLLFFCSDRSYGGRIRNRKVKEAPKTCGLMVEDKVLTRDSKKVFGTLRHSIVIESAAEQSQNDSIVTLVKDKGEKICQWHLNEWDSKTPTELVQNDLEKSKFQIDEFKEVLYSYKKNTSGTFSLVSIPFQSCDTTNWSELAKLELPKCGVPPKLERKTKRKNRKLASSRKINR